MNPTQEAKRLVDDAFGGSGNWDRNYARARALIEAALESDPDNITLLTCLGAILSDTGQHAQAVPVLKRAVKLGSTDRHTYFNLAVATLNRGSHVRADKLFAQAAGLQGGSETWEAYFDPHGH